MISTLPLGKETLKNQAIGKICIIDNALVKNIFHVDGLHHNLIFQSDVR